MTEEEKREQDEARKKKAQGISEEIGETLREELFEDWKALQNITDLIGSGRITPEMKTELFIAGEEVIDRMQNVWKIEKKVFNKALYPREYEERLAEEKKEAEERERARAKLDIEALFENVEELAETGETAGSTEVEIKEAINYFTGEELAEMQKIANRAGERIKQERERKQSERKNGANGSK